MYAVIHHFQLTPPSIQEITDTNLKRVQKTLSPQASGEPAHNNYSASTHPPPSYRESSQQSTRPDVLTPYEHHLIMEQEQYESTVKNERKFEIDDAEVNALIPPIPSTFPEFDTMGMSELRELVDDPTSFVKNRTRVDTIKELKQSIETSNENAARANLEQESRVEEIRTEAESLKQQLNIKVQRYKELDEERAKLTHPPDISEVIKELNVAKKKIFRESEELADMTDIRNENVSDFVKKFMESRVLYHIRAAKVERLEMSM